jgi:uncharacterized protein YggE
MPARIVLAAIFTACALSPALAQPPPPPSISVTGEATISVPPDLAQIDGGVTTEAKTAREASEANNKAMGTVLLALKNAGIPEKDFQTSRLSLQPQSSTTRGSTAPAQIVGYRASNRVTVTVRDVTKLASVIDALVGGGANDISGIHFAVSESSKLLDKARGEALADARRKAEIYANAAGVTLGQPLSISEQGGSAPPIVFRRMAADMAASAPIAQGEETLRMAVSVSYEIKPKAP